MVVFITRKDLDEMSKWRSLLQQGSLTTEEDPAREIREKLILQNNPKAAKDPSRNCTDCGKRCASAV